MVLQWSHHSWYKIFSNSFLHYLELWHFTQACGTDQPTNSMSLPTSPLDTCPFQGQSTWHKAVSHPQWCQIFRMNLLDSIQDFDLTMPCPPYGGYQSLLIREIHIKLLISHQNLEKYGPFYWNSDSQFRMFCSIHWWLGYSCIFNILRSV